ncbi:iron uptake transporter permease EfeU [Schaalia suimastitidis]|uniref:iron uptake transporter permease EfeU n=1 Tax=Schaalia suimastitidis TaxID=121163 RepID=UPI00040B3C8A|nr:iron uptake transporter permease EfeU [Schaalia suimastitidis]
MFLANFLIALREGVEAALVVGIILAYLAKVGRRDLFPRVAIGVVLATIIPLGAGAWMTWGPYTLSFVAQEVIGGTLSLLAVAMVTWMILWMSGNAHTMVAQLKEDVAQALDSGFPWGIVWIAIVAVAREGIETALFVWATVKSSASQGALEPSLAVLCGLLVAIVIGWAVYTGAVRINLRVFFNATGLLLIIVAAGIVSYGIGDFQEANILPGWGIAAYDFTHLVDGSIAPWLNTASWWWILLEAMFNLNAAPTHLQVLGWCFYMAIVLPIFLVRSGMVGPKRTVITSNTQTASATAHADAQ